MTSRSERDQLLAFLDTIQKMPCILVFFRAGPTGYAGPFPDWSAADRYRRDVAHGGQIHPLMPPDENGLDWSVVGSLAG